MICNELPEIFILSHISSLLHQGISEYFLCFVICASPLKTCQTEVRDNEVHGMSFAYVFYNEPLL